MADREFVFSNPAIQKLIREKFVPLAMDDWYLRRQNDEHGKERASGLGHRFIARQVPQNGTPIYAPGRAGMNTECSWSANNGSFGKSLQTKGLVGIV